MYLRLRCVVTGDIGDICQPSDNRRAQANLKLKKSVRGVQLISSTKGLNFLAYNTMFKLRDIRVNVLDFDFVSNDYSWLSSLETPGVFEIGGLKFDLFKQTVLLRPGQTISGSLVDLNLPCRFSNSITNHAVNAGKPTIELLSDPDLLTLSVFTEPVYQTSMITMDYVKIARDILISKGFVTQSDYDTLDEEYKFTCRGELVNVNLYKI